MLQSKRRFSIWIALALIVMATPAFAGGGGGGGTKRNATIKFVNQTADIIAVTTNYNSAAIQAALAALPTDATSSVFIAAWQAAGGKILNPGQSYSASVSAGTYAIGAGDVTAIEANADTPVLGTNEITENVTVGRGQTYKVYIGSPAAGTIAFTNN